MRPLPGTRLTLRLARGLLCALLLSSASPAQPASASPALPWPAAPVRTALDTPFGTLAVRPSAYVFGATLIFDGEPTTPLLQGRLNIPYAFSMGKRRFALVSQDQGLIDCPLVYYWVTLSSQGYTVSTPFGSCSAAIRVQPHGHQLRMQTPRPDEPGEIDTWIFDGAKVYKR